MTRKSWRGIYPVHPAADVFPMITNEELKDLGKDIKKNGLKQPIVFWQECSGDDEPERSRVYVLDGRNRLAAMELAGMPLVKATIGNNPQAKLVSAKVLSASFGGGGLGPLEERVGEVPDPAAYVISANIKRRHLSKKQQADLIVKVVASATSTDLAKMAKSVKRTTKGRVQGSTKDPVKAKVLEEAEKNDISKRTAERALADAKPKSDRVYVTCPECSAQTAALDKHISTKHKVKTPKQPTKAQIAKADQAMDDLQKVIAKGASRTTVRQLEKALMNAQQATGSISVYEVLADKAALKQMLRLYDQLEESITLGREKIKNRPPDKEIARALSTPSSEVRVG